jgi:ketosteroid isomerase-like protein
MNAAEQVITAAEARASALAAGDAERLAVLLHEDFRWTAHVGETYSRGEYIRRNTDGSTVWRSQELHSAEVVVVGDTAVLYAEVVDVVRSGTDDSETFRMPMTQVWVRQAGGWRCLAGHAGPRRTDVGLGS